MFYQDLIDLNIAVDTEEQLFDLVGTRVISQDFANLGYIANLEKRELAYPTGLKFADIALALPHVDPQYVKRPFIYLARTISSLKLKQMGDSSDISAQNFLFLGLKNGEKQPELLAKIIAAFQDQSFVEQFQKTKDSQNMLQLVEAKFRGLSK
ncbi:MAG: PTS sugar transporter subunit IIA [Lactobacillus panisapium]